MQLYARSAGDWTINLPLCGCLIYFSLVKSLTGDTCGWMSASSRPLLLNPTSLQTRYFVPLPFILPPTSLISPVDLILSCDLLLDSSAQIWMCSFNRGFHTAVNWKDYFIYVCRGELPSYVSAGLYYVGGVTLTLCSACGLQFCVAACVCSAFISSYFYLGLA